MDDFLFILAIDASQYVRNGIGRVYGEGFYIGFALK